MVRKPIVDSQFYAADSGELINEIEESFNHKQGPGMPEKRGNKKILGVISGHAGYSFSGPAAAYSFKEIAESEFPDLYIIFGTSHSGFDSCISLEDWETPLGTVKTDTEFGKTLVENSSLIVDEVAHQNEHSIEVQLPFLQFVSKDNIEKLRILAINVSEDINLNEFAQNIKKTLEQLNKKAVFIASSDLTHYGYHYRYVPFIKDIQENLHKLDNEAISFIKKRDSEKFLQFCAMKKATICGKYPIAALIEISKVLNARKAELLQYYTSGDISGDYNNSVGYAAIVFER